MLVACQDIRHTGKSNVIDKKVNADQTPATSIDAKELIKGNWEAIEIKSNAQTDTADESGFIRNIKYLMTFDGSKVIGHLVHKEDMTRLDVSVSDYKIEDDLMINALTIKIRTLTANTLELVYDNGDSFKYKRVASQPGVSMTAPVVEPAPLEPVSPVKVEGTPAPESVEAPVNAIVEVGPTFVILPETSEKPVLSEEAKDQIY